MNARACAHSGHEETTSRERLAAPCAHRPRRGRGVFWQHNTSSGVPKPEVEGSPVYDHLSALVILLRRLRGSTQDRSCVRFSPVDGAVSRSLFLAMSSSVSPERMKTR
jgi:hypothetical protein